jgi:transcriptional regulator with XRE-family HTH domain
MSESGSSSERVPVPKGTGVRFIRKRATQQEMGVLALSSAPRDLHKEARLAMVAKLAIIGLTQVEIAEKMGLSQPTISQSLTEIRRRWLETSLVSYDTMKSAELAKINEIERQQWDEIEELRLAEEEEKRKAWWAKRNNAAYGRVMWCVEQRCKLFGLYAPQEVISWKAEAAQAGYDPDTIYRILVHEMSTIIDGTAKVVEEDAGASEHDL